MKCTRKVGARGGLSSAESPRRRLRGRPRRRRGGCQRSARGRGRPLTLAERDRLSKDRDGLGHRLSGQAVDVAVAFGVVRKLHKRRAEHYLGLDALGHVARRLGACAGQPRGAQRRGDVAVAQPGIRGHAMHLSLVHAANAARGLVSCEGRSQARHARRLPRELRGALVATRAAHAEGRLGRARFGVLHEERAQPCVLRTGRTRI